MQQQLLRKFTENIVTYERSNFLLLLSKTRSRLIILEYYIALGFTTKFSSNSSKLIIKRKVSY